MNASQYNATTFGIKISVKPSELEQHSDPSSNAYAFAYTVTIENSSNETVQLLERHWIVISNGEQVAEVVGQGVVGLQPTIEPGETFTYSSSTVIQHPIGSMHGTYSFRSNAGTVFEAQIPQFDLVCRSALN